MFKMIFWILIIIILTPWFWIAPLPKNLFNFNLAKDVTEVKIEADWERGKISPSNFNRFFLNWPIKVVSERVGVVMENLDIGNYFFVGHPRERVGVVEKQKFFFFEFLLLVVGFTSKELRKYKKFLIIYSLTALLLVFLFKWRDFHQTVFLSLPFIVLMALGLKKIFYGPRKWLVALFVFAFLETTAFIFYMKGD